MPETRSNIATAKPAVPLCVDLDGTLLKTDLLWECLVRLLKQNPLYCLRIPFWWMRGRARLKAELARRVQLDVAMLPLNEAFIAFLRAQKAAGRPLILVTASDAGAAQPVAAHLGLFTEVLGSDGRNNLRGKRKAATLTAKFGRGGFDYAGNSRPDLPVWAEAREAIVVNAGAGLIKRARGMATVSQVFARKKSLWQAALLALRPHQWVKNLIIFVPPLAAHELGQWPVLSRALLAFAAFCLCASAAYIVNDLLDLDSDRRHPSKRLRPFASGDLPVSFGLALCPALLAAAVAVSLALPLHFAMVLAGYLVLTKTYSWRLKQFALLDVFCLAGLYTARLIAGHEATGAEYSSWLLVFSMFIFLSLGLLKRFTELKSTDARGTAALHVAGYEAADAWLVAGLGACSGYLAVLVLALYVNSAEVRVLYQYPKVLLLICPLQLYWISRVWLLAHRGRMHDDPIVFALKDRVSYLIGALTLAVMWLASGH